MLRSLRSALARFAMRRAAACQREAPKRADLWLRLGCALTPAFAETYPALVQLRRAIEDRWGAVAAALWLNAQALFQAGDVRAADEALHLWATQVPDGLSRLSQARAELFPEKRGS